MTKKELAEKLRWYGNLAAMGPVDCELPEEACDDLFEAADALEAMRWVPVTERLPELIPCCAGTEYSEAVIVWTTGKKAMVAVWCGIDWIAPFGFWEAWSEEITHWMPPPRGPEEVE